jgi:hypothetical protein
MVDERGDTIVVALVYGALVRLPGISCVWICAVGTQAASHVLSLSA